MISKITVKAPSSTANLGPGFDVFGLAVDAFYDTVTLTKIKNGIKIITEDNIPTDPEKNTAGLVVKNMKKKFKIKEGIEIAVKAINAAVQRDLATGNGIDLFIIDKNGVSNFDFQQIKVEYEFLSEAKSLEGFLFPDTYRFERDTDVKYVVMRLLDTFSDKAWPILRKEDDWMSNLILASFLEREVPDFNDRRMVSGILLNRMRIGMPLQVDATVAYIKCDGGFVLCGEGQILSKKDLSMPSPYNTYQRLGWTPTPIANPGEAAIKATVTPIDSSYIYYLSDPETQNTIFSRTLEEHNVNRVKYL